MRKYKNIRTKYPRGFTLIEALILLMLFTIATLAFYKMYVESVRLIIEAKRRIAAIELAKERMEHIRNIPYDDIGIVGGAVSGSINPDDVAEVNGIRFRIITNIIYIDDPNDGLVSTPPPNNDINFDDYKRVHLYVLWGDATDQTAVPLSDAISSTWRRTRVELTSTFVPPGGIEGATNNGVLSIDTVKSTDGTPVSGVGVTIFCSGCQDGTNDVNDSTQTTDTQGNLTYSTPPSSNGPAGSANYVLSVTKSGYQTQFTGIPYNGASAPDPGSYQPQHIHQTVLQGQLTTIVFAMVRLYDFDLVVSDPHCQPIPGAHTIKLTGGYLVGSNKATTPESNVYARDTFFNNRTVTTDSSGKVRVYTDTNADGEIKTDGTDKASGGAYSVDVAAFNVDNPTLMFWKFLQYIDDVPNMMSLDKDYIAPSAPCSLIALDKTVNSIFVTVQDNSDPTNITPVKDATVGVENTTAGYVSSAFTDAFGKAYFPDNASILMTSGDYDVRVSKAGYKVHSETITIASGLKTTTINLIPDP